MFEIHKYIFFNFSQNKHLSIFSRIP